MRARLRTVLLVASRELLESLRDKRTLFVALVLPVLLYPLVTLGLGSVVQSQKKKLAAANQRIAVTGSDAAAVRTLVLERAPSPAGEDAGAALEVVESADPRADLAAGKLQLWVEAAEDFARTLAEDGTARVVVRFDGADDRSREAREKWTQAYEAAKARELDARMVRRGLPEAWRKPLEMDWEDVSPPERSAAYAFGRVLAMLLVLMTVTSSFYPAVDAVAGEKERGTMETLLVAPCGRTELVLGKFLAVLVVTLAAAVLNLASLALTTGPLVGALGPARAPAVHVTGDVVLGILALLLPLSALCSALSLSLSTVARSVKEAQHYLSPLVMVLLPMAMVVILPNLPLTRTLAAVPVTNVVLFFRDLLIGKAEWGTGIVVFASTLTFAGLAIWTSVLLFLREETLFRGPEDSGLPLRRPAPRTLPTAPSAVFLFAASLAALWYAQGALSGDIVANLLVTQLAIVLTPCLLLAWWMRLDLAPTFRLTRPSAGAWTAVALAVPLGIALPLVSSYVHHAVSGPPAADGSTARLEEQMQALVGSTGAVPLALLLGVLPAVCEEIVYRGFVLSGLAQAWTSWRGRIAAVVATAAFFALSHVIPEKLPNTFAVGLVLGWLALRTGSLLPGIVAHALHNAAAVVAAKHEGADWVVALYGRATGPDGAPLPPEGTRVAAAVAVVAAGLAVTWVVTRRRDAAAVRGT